jgi:hypothetical protein
MACASPRQSASVPPETASGRCNQYRKANAPLLALFAQDLGDCGNAAAAAGTCTTGFRDCLFSLSTLANRRSNRAVTHTLTMTDDHFPAAPLGDCDTQSEV